MLVGTIRNIQVLLLCICRERDTVRRASARYSLATNISSTCDVQFEYPNPIVRSVPNMHKPHSDKGSYRRPLALINKFLRKDCSS